MAVVWTKPEEWVPKDSDPLFGLIGVGRDSFRVAFVDGHIGEFNKQTPAEMLRRLFNRNDRQTIPDYSLERLLKAAVPPVPPPASLRPPSSQKTLALQVAARQDYHDTFQTYPPAYTATPDGKPLLSWRVSILQFLLDQRRLYDEFHHNEPWNSEHNKQLIPKMPQVYLVPGSKTQPKTTRYLGVGGKSGVITRPAVGMASIIDGTSNTLAIVEASDSAAVIWTKPEEWIFDDKEPVKGLVNPQSDGFFATAVDGAIYRIPNTTSAEILRRMFIANDEKSVDFPPPIPQR